MRSSFRLRVAHTAGLSALAAGLVSAGAIAGEPPKTVAQGATQKSGAPQTTSPANSVFTIMEGRIIGVEEGNLVVDVGSRAGATVGQVAELWRPLKLRHPATGKVVEDRYRIGSLRITEVLEVVSFASAEGETRRSPLPGDIVVLRVAPKASPPAPKAGVPVSPQNAAVAASADPDAEAVAALIASLHAASLEERVQKYDAWLREHPSNRFAGAVSEELEMLRRLSQASNESEATTPGATAAPQTTPEVESLQEPRFLKPTRAFSGAPLDFGVEIAGPLRGAVLHSRGAHEVAYVSTPMRLAGSRFWVATIGADRVRAPRLEYFIEAVGPDGTTAPIVGNVDAPLRLKVQDPPQPSPPLHHRSMASIYTDYADYNRLKGNDRVWQTEGVFGMRFGDTGVRALRSGFGVYRGIGGSVQDLDVEHLSPREVGLTYGHLEGEFGFSPAVSVIARAVVGLGDSGVTGGGQAIIRIGNDLETNLLVGGELLGGIGLRGMAELQLYPEGRVPVALRTEVTNQPAGSAPDESTTSASSGESDIGGRAIVQAGYRVFAPLVVFARVSYQGRTISHSGPGFGGGVTYEW